MVPPGELRVSQASNHHRIAELLVGINGDVFPPNVSGHDDRVGWYYLDNYAYFRNN